MNSNSDAAKTDDKKRSRREKAAKIITVVILSVMLCASIMAIALSTVLGKIDFVDAEDMAVPENLNSIVLEDEQDEAVSGSDTLDDEQMMLINEAVSASKVGEDGLRSADGITNILVLGTDGRVRETKRARSDVIMIMSIDDNTKRIVLNTIMRDTYVSIPGRDGNDKINAAHAYGGPALSIATIEGAFGIKIDHFVSVNFYAFMDIVDALGGVTVDINKSEKQIMNNYIQEINRYYGNCGKDDGKLIQSGDNITLTGKQAMGYVRIRYTGNGDYERTERQREVLEQLIRKARETDYLTLLGIVDKVASNLSTDYSPDEITKLALNAGDYTDYDIVQNRIPVEGSYWGGMYHGIWILQIDFDMNRQALYETIFGE